MPTDSTDASPAVRGRLNYFDATVADLPKGLREKAAGLRNVSEAFASGPPADMSIYYKTP
jgi:hypothetical protein